MRSAIPPLVAVVTLAVLGACAAPGRQAPVPVALAVPAAPARLVYENRPTAERTLAGRMIDDKTGLPIKVAGEIRLDDRATAATTDAYGHVDVDSVAPGMHAIVAMAPGFLPRTDTVTVADGRGVAIEVRLLRAPVEAGMLVRPAPQAAYVVPQSINARRAVGTELANTP